MSNITFELQNAQYGHIGIREETDAVVHRRVISPGDDTSGLPQELQDFAASVWTPEVTAVWQAYKAAHAPHPFDPDAADTDALNAALTAPGSVTRALGQALFTVANDVRVLKSQQPITMAQFKTYLKDLMRS